MTTVLVTGVSGFLGGHVALALLNAGYRVRGSTRSAAKGARARAALEEAGADVARFETVELDLMQVQGWDAAMQGCAFLQHTASPFVLRMPKDRQRLIGPAVSGTRHALNAALAAGVDRVVLTSSIAAVVYGHGPHPARFTEADWTRPEGPGVNAYTESKLRAERAAWEAMAAAGARDRLAVINPGVILGPLLDDDPGTSATLVQELLRGRMPMVPRLLLEYVDVRDVAAAHLAAMTAPEAAGRRHIVSGQMASLLDLAGMLRTAFPGHARRLPRRELPDALVRLGARLVPALKGAADQLGPGRATDASVAEALLGRPLRPTQEAVLATGQSLIDRGLV